MKIFGREPALVLGVVSAALGLVVTFNIGMSAEQAGAITALLSAVGAAVTAALTRPVAPSAFTGVVAAGAALLAAYGFEVSPETVGAVNALVLAVLMLLTRGQVAPVEPKSARTLAS
ncbi:MULTISPECIES: hypothetical protein [Streptomycetaceae]|uniref:hypothetical protein n=1 Tax=Streptomycetaceae TaxID=2062 RepID=UPI00037520F2|nr:MULTISPECIES: hypothetical protein [Streptomycetaceae]